MKRTLLFVLLLSMTACSAYVPPRSYNFDTDRVYSSSFDQVWTNLISFFSEYGIPIKTIDKSSGLIATDYDLSAGGIATIMDCGTPASDLNVYKFENQTANFNVQVVKISEGQTKVRVKTFFRSLYVRYSSTQNGNWVRTGSSVINCNSMGAYEQALLNSLGN